MAWPEFVNAEDGSVELGSGFEGEVPGRTVKRSLVEIVDLDSEENPERELVVANEGDIQAQWIFHQVSELVVIDYSSSLAGQDPEGEGEDQDEDEHRRKRRRREKKRSYRDAAASMPKREDAQEKSIPIKRLVLRLPSHLLNAPIMSRALEKQIVGFDVVLDRANLPEDYQSRKFGVYEKSNPGGSSMEIVVFDDPDH